MTYNMDWTCGILGDPGQTKVLGIARSGVDKIKNKTGKNASLQVYALRGQSNCSGGYCLSQYGVFERHDSV